MLVAGLSLAGCETLPTPEKSAAIKAEEDAVAAADDASENAEGGSGGVGAVGNKR